MSKKKLDTMGWFICTLHQLLGHRQTAAFIGQPAGNRTQCILCEYEEGMVDKQAVIDRIGVER